MENINLYLEHTLLNPLVTSTEIEQLVNEAKEYEFVGICVPPYWVEKAKRDLGTSDIALATVIGFPLGYQRTDVKIKEMEVAIKDGASELDVVLNLSAAKMKAYDWIKPEIARMTKFAHDREILIKIILETCYWNDEQLIELCKLCVDAGVDYLKSSTGFAPSGADLEKIRLMRKTAPTNVGIKASGGIKLLDQVVAFIEAGAGRIGTSNAVAIMKELKK